MKKLITIFLITLSCSAFGQDKSIFYEPAISMKEEDYNNFYIANRHKEPMKNRPSNEFYQPIFSSNNNCQVQFDVWKDTIVIFQPVQFWTKKCLINTVFVKSKTELDYFKKHFPKVKIPQRILSKIK